MNTKNILKQIGLILIIVLIATIIDYFTHSTSQSFYVPAEYYRNKIIFATVWGLIAILILENWIKNPTKLAIAMSATIAVVLQTKYFFLGYDLFFVFLFMFLHFVMFLIPSILIFRKYQHMFVKQNSDQTLDKTS